jgi:hypothetical protein
MTVSSTRKALLTLTAALTIGSGLVAAGPASATEMTVDRASALATVDGSMYVNAFPRTSRLTTGGSASTTHKGDLTKVVCDAYFHQKTYGVWNWAHIGHGVNNGGSADSALRVYFAYEGRGVGDYRTDCTGYEDRTFFSDRGVRDTQYWSVTDPYQPEIEQGNTWTTVEAKGNTWTGGVKWGTLA